jgi:hypothetical protein
MKKPLSDCALVYTYRRPAIDVDCLCLPVSLTIWRTGRQIEERGKDCGRKKKWAQGRPAQKSTVAAVA